MSNKNTDTYESLSGHFEVSSQSGKELKRSEVDGSRIVAGQPEPQRERSIEEIEIDRDFAISREKFKYLLTAGESALQSALELAEQADSPRAFEVVATLIKNLAEASEKNVSIHEHRARVRRANSENEEGGANRSSVTNNLLVTDTNSLLRMLKQAESRDDSKD